MKGECNINATAPTIFSKQLSNVIDLFQQWNDCERAVMLFAVLKKVPFPITKFLQSVIDASLQQAQCKEQAKVLERNANCAKYINSLSETYKSLKCNETQFTTDSIFFASDRSIDNIDRYYDKKEEILRDILKMMPILTIGNDEAKLAYLDFIPMTVSDATRRIVSSTLVQQLFCYVLIHPAFSTDDRGSVVKYLKDLEAHISSNEPNFFLYRNGSSPTSEPTNPSTPSNWQAIAPPQSKSTETIPSSWGSGIHLTRSYGDDRNQPTTTKDDTNDDHHTSFLNNGKIVHDVTDDDTNKSNTQVGFVTLSGVTKHLGMLDNSMLKTRRSNSLTTTSQMTRPSYVQIPNEKQRSFSLSGISTLNCGGFDTSNLDDHPKPVFQSPQQHHHVGMSNIAQWLKSLRLHKYVCLFSHQTYEQLLEITEEHLITVTKGARHKLINCIQKLKERYGVLCQMEKDLLCGQVTMAKAVDELFHIVLTPMKPIEPFNKHDVASQFLKVLDLVSTKMTAKQIVPQDEECVNTLVWILEKAMHNEAFVAQTNVLREHRYNMQRIKNQFPSKSHYSKSNASSSASSSNNGHRQRAARTIQFQEFLPAKVSSSFTSTSSFTSYNRSNSNVIPLPSFSDVTKYPFFYGQEQRIGTPIADRYLFKIPQLPVTSAATTTYNRNQTISGSVESISSGYHSDGYLVGMGNIRKWLKSLRLHKYTWVFDNVSYEKMFTFTEDYLKSLKITQGASHKLAICIEKLNTRADVMKQIVLNLSQNRMFVPEAIYEMESMVLSPMKPMRFNCDTDAGYQLWNVINFQINSSTDLHITLFNLIALNNYDEPTVQSFQRIVESAVNSEAFVDYACILRDMRMKVARLGRRMIR